MRLVKVQPEGAQVHRFDPTANVRQRHKRRLRFARKHQALFEDFCRVREIRFKAGRNDRCRVRWTIRKADGSWLLSWIPELGRAFVPEMEGIVFKIHDPFVLAWFVDGLLEVEKSKRPTPFPSSASSRSCRSPAKSAWSSS